MAASQLQPCSQSHLGQMRALVLASHYIVELGYMQQGRLRCTSWGPSPATVAHSTADFVVKRGIAVTTRLRPLANPQHPLMALQLRDYNVLINPTTLTDINLPPGLQLAIGTPDGQILSSTGTAAERLLIAPPTDASGTDADGQVLSGRDRRGDWAAVVTEPAAYLRGPLAGRTAAGGAGRHCAGAAVGQPGDLGIAAAVVAAGTAGDRGPAQRVRRALPADHRAGHRRLRRCRGAGALAATRWRADPARCLHPAGRRKRFDPADHRSGGDRSHPRPGPHPGHRPLLHVAINVSAEDIKSGRVQTVLAQALHGTSVDSGQLWVEATERSLMDIEAARTTITHLRGAGHTVSIDDFGTGYSSLQYLQGLPLDALKIDKSFVDTIGTHSATSAVTSHIIDMAKTLQLRTIAEGVERQEQLDYLRAHGVDLAQGWLFSRALPATGFIAYHALMRGVAH